MTSAPSVYIETSVVSYLVARPSKDVVTLAHQIITVDWREARLQFVRPFVSPYVIEELGRGNPSAAERRLAAVREIPVLPSTPDAEDLARVYLAERLLPEGELADALHLALASAHALDYLLT